MRKWHGPIVGALVVGGLVGCAAAPPPSLANTVPVVQSGQVSGCPVGAHSVAVFSTEQADASDLVFLGETGVLERRRIPYGGLAASPTDSAALAPNGSWWLNSKGTLASGNTHLLRFDTKDCTVHAFAAKEPAINNLVVSDSAVYSSNHLSGEGLFRRRSNAGEILAEKKYEDIGAFSMTLVKDRLFVVAARLGAEDEVVVLVLDADSLEMIKEIPVANAWEPGFHATVKDNALIFPVPNPESGGAGELVRMDLSTYRVSRSDSAFPKPELFARVNDVDYVVNVDMTQSDQALLEHGVVTKILPGAASDSSPQETDGPFLAMRSQGDRLLLLTEQPDDVFGVSAYSTPDLARVQRWEIPASDLPAQVYAAGLLVLN